MCQNTATVLGGEAGSKKVINLLTEMLLRLEDAHAQSQPT
jgi:hypothetical protein